MLGADQPLWLSYLAFAGLDVDKGLLRASTERAG